MYFFLLSSFFFLLSSFFFLSSCEEKSNAVKHEAEMPKISNYDNPYEIVGDLHSQGLEFIKNNYLDEINPNLVEDSTTLYNNLTQVTAIFVKNISDSLYPENTITIDEICNCLQTIEIKGVQTLEQKYDDLLNDDNLTDTEKYYIQKISDATNIDTFDDEDYNNSVNIYCNRIIDIEAQILAEVFNEAERMHLLSFTAVLRDSYSYWFNEFNNPNSMWFTINLIETSKINKTYDKTLGLSKAEKEVIKRVAGYALTDAGGALHGAAGCGLVFGPGGAVLGGTAGAIKATVGAAVVDAAISALVDWFF